jgi:hypothetical protein
MRYSLGFRAGVLIPSCAAMLIASALGLSAQALGMADRAVAREAKTTYLVESSQLKFTGEEGSSLDEHGTATGTYDAPVSAKLTIHPTYVTAIVTIFPRGGSITGTAEANYIVQKSTGYFGGTLTVTNGTGTFRHASGKSLGISGTINRYTFAATVKAHGEISL